MATTSQLPAHWKQRDKTELAEHAMFGLDPKSRESGTSLKDTDFLQAVCLVSTHHQRRGRKDLDPFTQPAASCKRADILDLELEEYLKWAPCRSCPGAALDGWVPHPPGRLRRGERPPLPRPDHLASRDSYCARQRDRLATG